MQSDGLKLDLDVAMVRLGYTGVGGRSSGPARMDYIHEPLRLHPKPGCEAAQMETCCCRRRRLSGRQSWTDFP